MLPLEVAKILVLMIDVLEKGANLPSFVITVLKFESSQVQAKGDYHFFIELAGKEKTYFKVSIKIYVFVYKLMT